MIFKKALLLSAVSFALTCGSFQSALAQNAPNESPESTQGKKAKKKKKKNKDDARKTSGEDAGETTDSDPQALEQKQPLVAQPRRESSSGRWFPDWTPDRFDWILQPIFGFKYTQGVNEETGTTRTTTVEGGLAGGVRGIPVVPGNPGFTTGPKAGVAYGYSNSVVKTPEGKNVDSGSHYRRQWIGLDNALYLHAFRLGLDLTRGQLHTLEDKDRSIQSLRVVADAGLLFKPWLSQHYTLTHARAYHSKFSTPFLVENDHWFHTRVFTDVMHFVFDFGPGVTDIVAWDFSGENKVGSGTVNYFLLKTQFNLFWKVVGEGVGKYALNASEKRLGLYATERLPEEDLNEPATLAMPEDSFLGSFFLGVKDLFFGVGVGWRYNIQVLHLAERGDTQRETTKNHGIGLYYEVRL